VSRWLKKVGDSVKRDEALFEISTDKVDAEIPAPAAGVLVEVLVGEGTTVAVQTVVARLETDAAAAVAAIAAPPAAAPAAAPTAAPTASSVAAELPPPAAPEPAAPAPPAGSLEERLRTKSSPLVRKLADVQQFEGALKRCVRVPLHQHEYDAFLSLAYNIGDGGFKGSTVLRAQNAGDTQAAARAFALWNKAGGRVEWRSHGSNLLPRQLSLKQLLKSLNSYSASQFFLRATNRTQLGRYGNDWRRTRSELAGPKLP
jgi:GH24 family phage-related lysozyme (muramidase)